MSARGASCTSASPLLPRVCRRWWWSRSLAATVQSANNTAVHTVGLTIHSREIHDASASPWPRSRTPWSTVSQTTMRLRPRRLSVDSGIYGPSAAVSLRLPPQRPQRRCVGVPTAVPLSVVPGVRVAGSAALRSSAQPEPLTRHRPWRRAKARPAGRPVGRPRGSAVRRPRPPSERPALPERPGRRCPGWRNRPRRRSGRRSGPRWRARPPWPCARQPVASYAGPGGLRRRPARGIGMRQQRSPVQDVSGDCLQPQT